MWEVNGEKGKVSSLLLVSGGIFWQLQISSLPRVAHKRPVFPHKIHLLMCMYMCVVNAHARAHTQRYKSVFRSTYLCRGLKTSEVILSCLSYTTGWSISLYFQKNLHLRAIQLIYKMKWKDGFQELRANWYGRIWVMFLQENQRWRTVNRYLLQSTTMNVLWVCHNSFMVLQLWFSHLQVSWLVCIML